VDTQAAIAVLSRDAKDKMESGLEDRINHPLIHRWKANVLLKRLSNATIDECLNHLNQAVSQGHADEWDLKLAAFVSARRFNNVATTLRLEGMTPGKPGFREEAASAVKAFAVLEGSFQRADTAAVKSCIAYLDSLTQSNNRMLGTPDWEVGAALAKMTTLPPEKASLCREAKSSAIERHKATLSRPDWEKQNQRVIALETALSQAQ